AEMASLRPLGGGVKGTRHQTLLSEAARLDQFPGVLHQTALRMRGVAVTEAKLREAAGFVKGDLAEQYQTRADRELYYAVGDLAAGASEAGIQRTAAGRGLERLGVRDIERALGARYVPGNAVLAILGDLGGLDLHRLIENEFGSIP